MRNKLNSNHTKTHTYFDLDIISKFESFEEFPKTKPVVLADSNGVILYANNSAIIKHKFKKGKNLFEVYSEPNLTLLFNNLITNNISSFCTDLILKDENNYYEGYLLNIEKVIFNNEEIFIVFIDSQNNRTKITQKINTYNQALESVNVGVMLAGHDAKINYLSTSFEKFLHIKIEDVYNKNITEAFKNHLSRRELNDLEHSIKNHKDWVKVVSDNSFGEDIIYNEIRLNTVLDNIDYSFSFIITANDITDHIKQERLLKRAEERQKSIINNISDPILIIRKEKNSLIFENANNSFIRNILERKDEINDEKELSGLLSQDLYSIIYESILNLNSEKRIYAQFHFTCQNNKRYLGKISFTEDNFDFTRLFIVNMTDITDQLEIERKLRDAYKKEISLNKLKSTFLANMSHEIRTPLNAIVGYSDLLEDDVKAMNYESSTKMTNYLKEGVNRLLKLVDNIVEVSLLESGNEEIELTNVELNKIINENKELWNQEGKSREIEFHYKFSKKNIIVQGNEEKLSRAIKEIVDNAVKYSKNGSKINISVTESNGFGKLQVTDHGIGIKKGSMEKIFQLFGQVEEVGYTRKYEGAGLGLSLANKLVSVMNGEIKIISKPNKGTSVIILLPTSI